MIYNIIIQGVKQAIEKLYQHKITDGQVQVQKTRKEFEGDLTLVVFPLTRIARKSPAVTAEEIGVFLKHHIAEVEDFNVIKGFLNLVIHQDYWLDFLIEGDQRPGFGCKDISSKKPVVIEFSSPNTNKPLHLGHVRNNLLGYSIARILEANGHKVKKVNLVNDRGIHICKTMLAYEKWGAGSTPKKAGIKGDKLVGNLYVAFDKENKKEIDSLVSEGYTQEEAGNKTSLMAEAREILKRWEAGDEKVRSTWEMMNSWVYAGFDETYHRMGVAFDKIYYESQTYLLGKELVREGLENGIVTRKADGSVWADLTENGLDEKLLLRDDGTSVYITQDLGTAQLRYDDFNPDRLLYVVGNEQNYHFDVLKIILKKLGKPWSDQITHVSYGMVELPEGKMKSREGNVVDADDLMDEMHETARRTTLELGKIEAFSDDEAEKLYEIIGLGALKYFILKVDPKKNMMFNPEESIRFDGNTGPFIQYTYARIQSLLRKATSKDIELTHQIDKNIVVGNRERDILKLLHDFPTVVEQAGKDYSPAQIANYIYELVKEYNGFYQDTPVLREENRQLVNFRLLLSQLTGKVIFSGMDMLGIQVPDSM